MRIDLTAMRDSNGSALTETHPIRKLLGELPWLHGLASVRMFLQMIVVQYRDRLTAAYAGGMIQPDSIESRRALNYFKNSARMITIRGESYSTYEYYQEALDEISRTARTVPRLRERSLLSFQATVAALMHAVRTHRPDREASTPRVYRTTDVVSLFGDDDTARSTGT
jgi:hypothetical protein